MDLEPFMPFKLRYTIGLGSCLGQKEPTGFFREAKIFRIKFS